MNFLSMVLAILAGIFTTLEGSINSQLGKQITPGIATLHSLLTGMTFIFLVNLFRGNLPQYARIHEVSPIWLIGGIFGASIIYLTSKSIPAIGITSTIILILTGQLISGLILDTIVNNLELSLRRMAGIILFLIGAIMFLKE